MPPHHLSWAVKKEIRAIAPGWLACLALLAAVALMDLPSAHNVSIAAAFLGAIALGALSMGHEYSGGTLSLLLSQPRRRPSMVLLKLSVLAPMLLTLSALGFVIGGGPQDEKRLVFVLPLLCGLCIAPWFTMLCRNSLAGIVFTAATPVAVMLVSEVSAAVKFGTGPAMAADALAFKAALFWWGMLAISAVAAAFSWRVFMRLEVTDGRGQAIRLLWLRAGTPPTATVPLPVHRRPLWLLAKKEWRLQQLTFAVSGLYVLGWFGLWSARSAIPDLHILLLFVLTALNVLAVPVLAGSLASAEERQLGTLDWQALLPMSARAQWVMKAGVTVGVACVLGLAVPMALASMTGSREIRDGVQSFLSAGVGFAVVFLSVMSLYVSSLSASSLPALLWSVAAGCGLMTFANSWLLMGVVRLGADPGFNPLGFLTWWTGDGRSSSGRLFVLLMVMSALAVSLYAGGLVLLLRFAQANHRSAERSARRMSRQLLSLGTFLATVLILWFGASRTFRVEAEANQRAFMQRTFGLVTLAAIDSSNRRMTSYTVAVFPETRSRYSGAGQLFMVEPAHWPRGQVETRLVPGRYSVVAVEPLAGESALTARDPELIARLKARAIPLTIAAGESKTLHLTLSAY
jgi:hypothetical protein